MGVCICSFTDKVVRKNSIITFIILKLVVLDWNKKYCRYKCSFSPEYNIFKSK